MSSDYEGEAITILSGDFYPGVGMVDHEGMIYGVQLGIYEEKVEPYENPRIGAELKFCLLSNLDAAALISDDGIPHIDCWEVNISDDAYGDERPDSLQDQLQMIIGHVFRLTADRNLLRQILDDVINGEDYCVEIDEDTEDEDTESWRG